MIHPWQSYLCQLDQKIKLIFLIMLIELINLHNPYQKMPGDQ